MKVNLPAKVRKALYVATVIGSPVVAYLATKGVIGDLEVTFWAALVTAISGLAAFNVTPDEE